MNLKAESILNSLNSAALNSAADIVANAGKESLGLLEETKTNSPYSNLIQTNAAPLAEASTSAAQIINAAQMAFAAASTNGDDIIYGTPNQDSLSGGKGNDIIYGLGDDDVLRGNKHNDILYGDDGDDKLYGNGGKDTLYGEAGSDLLSGGGGDDVLVYSGDAIWPTGFAVKNVGSPSEVIDGAIVSIHPLYRSYDGFNGGNGIDTILMTSESDVLVLDDRTSPNAFGTDKARIKNVEIIEAGDGDDVVDFTSKDFSYGDVTIYGGNGNDVLWSSEGNDIIYGGAGNDSIDGGAGDDIFYVGEGRDKIYTRSGDDLIIYDSFDSSVDRIYEFETGLGADTLDISDILSGYDPLTDVIDDFVSLDTYGRHTALYVNTDGDPGGKFTRLAFFQEGIDDTLTELIDNANLIV